MTGESPRDPDGANSLQAATSIAVAENQLLARQTADELLALAASLHTTRPDAETETETETETDEATAAVLTDERNLLAAITSQLEELAHRQLDGMDAFNIVLFGRTGTGKSSLLEALSAGDGGSVSPGDSDWTTDVRPVTWRSCRVTDTPGIQGWGRTTARQDLEERARQALVTADVVLLCFDTWNQQAGEFGKVADWIAEFRKPAIAVLNVRTSNWRFPTRVPRRAARQGLSQTVADHAGHIREELAAIGLVDVPLVALHTQRAVFARAREPIRVPKGQLRSLHKLRAEIGAEQLLTWSNLPILENLLSTAVRSGATQLRRGMLLHQLTRTLDQAGELLHTTVETPARIAAEQSERGIEQMLRVLGAPEAYLAVTADTAEPATNAAVQAVAETFDTVRDELIAWFMDAARQALVVRLAAVAEQALLLREVAATAVANREAVNEVADRIRRQIHGSKDSGAILREAVRACEADEPTAAFGRSGWLGESWCDDPAGLVDGPVPPIEQLRRHVRSAMGEKALERLKTVFAEVTATPPPGTGQTWLAQLAQLLTADRHAAPVLGELYQLVADQRPRVLIYGDYNVGKSSFIKRLLIDDEQQVPDTLTVRGAPETAAVHTYPWADLVLIDTPGLQSGVPLHAELAQSQIPDSALVIYVLGASGVVGDRGGLDLILRGDPARGIEPKLDRTLFVVNRADELSINPFDDEEAFAQVVVRKEGELREALVATPELRKTGVTIPEEGIIFVAADPGGQVSGNRAATRADFDPFRHWDGMDEIRTVIDEFRPGLQANSVDVSVLHGGLARLGALAAATRDEAETLREQLTERDKVNDDLGSVLQASRMMEANSRTMLEHLVTNAIDQLVGEALRAKEDARPAILDRAVRFWEDDEVGHEVDRWADWTRRQAQEWMQNTSVVLQRRVHSYGFQRSLAGVEGLIPVQFPEQSDQRETVSRSGSALAKAIAVTERLRVAKVLQAGTEKAARVLIGGLADGLGMAQGVTQHRLMTMAKAIFIKREAAATAARIGRNAARANVVLQVVTTAVELRLLIHDHKTDRRKEVEFSVAIRALREQAVGWARNVADADPALASIREERAALDDALSATVADRSARQLELDTLLDRLAVYDQAMDLGRSALNASAFADTAAFVQMTNHNVA